MLPEYSGRITTRMIFDWALLKSQRFPDWEEDLGPACLGWKAS